MEIFTVNKYSIRSGIIGGIIIGTITSQFLMIKHLILILMAKLNIAPIQGEYTSPSDLELTLIIILMGFTSLSWVIGGFTSAIIGQYKNWNRRLHQCFWLAWGFIVSMFFTCFFLSDTPEKTLLNPNQITYHEIASALAIFLIIVIGVLSSQIYLQLFYSRET